MVQNTGWITCNMCGNPATLHEVVDGTMLSSGHITCPSCGLYVSWEHDTVIHAEYKDPDPELADYLKELSAKEPPAGEFHEEFWSDVAELLDAWYADWYKAVSHPTLITYEEDTGDKLILIRNVPAWFGPEYEIYYDAQVADKLSAMLEEARKRPEAEVVLDYQEG
ncbi:hypothetical protein [Thermus phage TSP4]|nr:hypothetical protein [Thermus phage TSP4]